MRVSRSIGHANHCTRGNADANEHEVVPFDVKIVAHGLKVVAYTIDVVSLGLNAAANALIASSFEFVLCGSFEKWNDSVQREHHQRFCTTETIRGCRDSIACSRKPVSGDIVRVA